MGVFRRRRPLVRGAVVGGAAYYVGKKRAERQAAEEQQDREIEDLQGEKYGNAQQTANSTDEGINKIKKLQAMHESGALTDEEFSKAKAKIISEI